MPLLLGLTNAYTLDCTAQQGGLKCDCEQNSKFMNCCYKDRIISKYMISQKL